MIATTQGSTRPGSRRDQLRRQFDDIADLVSLAKTIPGGADVTLDFGWIPGSSAPDIPNLSTLARYISSAARGMILSDADLPRLVKTLKPHRDGVSFFHLKKTITLSLSGAAHGDTETPDALETHMTFASRIYDGGASMDLIRDCSDAARIPTIARAMPRLNGLGNHWSLQITRLHRVRGLVEDRTISVLRRELEERGIHILSNDSVAA